MGKNEKFERKIIEEIANRLAEEEFDKEQEIHHFSSTYQSNKQNFLKKVSTKKIKNQIWIKTCVDDSHYINSFDSNDYLCLKRNLSMDSK